jgi:hypothetical protein
MAIKPTHSRVLRVLSGTGTLSEPVSGEFKDS